MCVDVPVVFHGWSAGGYASAAPLERLSVDPVPPKPAGPSDVELGVAAGPHPPLLPRPVGPRNIKTHRRLDET